MEWELLLEEVTKVAADEERERLYSETNHTKEAARVSLRKIRNNPTHEYLDEAERKTKEWTSLYHDRHGREMLHKQYVARNVLNNSSLYGVAGGIAGSVIGRALHKKDPGAGGLAGWYVGMGIGAAGGAGIGKMTGKHYADLRLPRDANKKYDTLNEIYRQRYLLNEREKNQGK